MNTIGDNAKQQLLSVIERVERREEDRNSRVRAAQAAVAKQRAEAMERQKLTQLLAKYGPLK